MLNDPACTGNKARKEIIKLALPAVLEQVLLTIVLITSTAIVSHLGADELLATTWNGNLFNIFMTAFLGLAVGTTVVVGRAYGMKKIATVKTVFLISSVLGTALGFIIGFMGYFFARPFFTHFYAGADPEVLEYAITYAQMTLPCLGFVAGEASIVGAIRGVGNNKMPFYYSIVINIINIVVSYMLVYGVFLPKVGYIGAAIGVDIARAVGFTIALIYAFFYNEHLKNSWKEFKKRNLIMLKRILNVGLPVMFENTVVQFGFLLLGIILIPLGTATQAGYNLSGNANSIVWAPINGLGITMTAMISRYLGAKEPEYCDSLVKASMKVAMVILAVSTFCEIAFAPQIVHFYTSELDVYQSGVFGLRCFGLLAPIFGLSCLEAGILKGAGAVQYVAATMFIALWVFRVGLVWIVLHVLHWGLGAVFVAVSLDFGTRAALYWLKIKKGDWKYIRV